MKIRHPIYWLIPFLVVPGLLFATYSSGKSQQQKLTTVVEPAKYRPQTQSSASLKGKANFEKHNCTSCHSIGGSGGCLAPPLDGIGARRSKTFILARITNEPGSIKQFEKLYPHAELMVHPRLSARSAGLIASYLMTLPEPAGGVRVGRHTVLKKTDSLHNQTPVQPTAQTIAKGKSLFYQHGCITCHALGNIGGHFAPRLDGISKRRDRDYITDRINSTEFLTQKTANEYEERGAVMPPTNLTEGEIQQVATFLMSLPSEP